MAYEGARKRAEATTHALDNPHLKTVPLEFGGAPAPSAWESSGSPDRPFVPGAGAATLPDAGGSMAAPPEVPEVPAVPETVPSNDPLKTNPPQADPPQLMIWKFRRQATTWRKKTFRPLARLVFRLSQIRRRRVHSIPVWQSAETKPRFVIKRQFQLQHRQTFKFGKSSLD